MTTREPGRPPLERDADIGLYVHIPFCQRICPYCDFAVVRASNMSREREERYVEAILSELRRRQWEAAGKSLSTVYFGGGTPSLLTPESLARILEFARECFPQSSEDLEITLEVNPSTIERMRLPGFREIGVNRLSVGIQSFDDETLRRLGRAHRAPEGIATLKAARRAGFDNLSIDLIVGAPGQRLTAFRRELRRVLSFAPEHLSAYELTIEPNTPFALADRRGQLRRASENTLARMLALLEEQAAAQGIERYEISNFARPGRESRHNRRYWQRRPVLGLGLGAWSNEAPSAQAPHGARHANIRDLGRYLEAIEDGRSALGELDTLDEKKARGEAMFLGLRQIVGVDAGAFEQEFGASPRAYFARPISQLVTARLLEEEPNGDLRLSVRGRSIADSVFAEFV